MEKSKCSTVVPLVEDVEDLYVTVMAGRWIRFMNGTWEFKIDMLRKERSINCRNVGSSEELRLLIASGYRIDAKVISVEMTYWIDELAEARPEPVEIVTDRCYRQFRSLCLNDRSISIFVTFRELIGDRLVILGEGTRNLKNGVTNVEEGGFSKKPDSCEAGPVLNEIEGTYNKGKAGVEVGKDGVENEEDEGIEEVEWMTGGDEDYDNEDGDVEEDRERGNEENEEEEYDDEDYEYDRWHEFVRNDCEWSSQELDWNEELHGCLENNESTGNITETYERGRKEKKESRGRKEKMDCIGRKKKSESTGRNKNNDSTLGNITKKGGLICYDGDDDFVDPPNSRTFVNGRRDNGGSVLKEGMSVVTEINGNDDIVDPPPCVCATIVRCRDNGSSGMKKGMSVTEVYGYADLQPMFRDTKINPIQHPEVDLSREDDDIYIGRVFKDKEDLKVAMAIYAITRVFRFVFSRHAKKSVTASCISRRCDWRVYAARIGDLDDYEVKKAHLTHRCDVDARGQFSKHATSKVIAKVLRAKYETIYGGPRARELPEMMLREYNIDASYWKCWKAKELAIASARGTEESSYQLLPLYLYVIKLANPGSITHLVTEVDGKGNPRFKYTFLALGASIQGWKHLRKLIVIDATHLHGRYKGCVMTASGQDANFQIFPIAFAVVDSENDDAWTWFMEKLSAIVEDSTNLTIISDRHLSIYCGINIVYPKAHHGACLVHIQRNVQSKYGRAMKAMVGRAGEAYRVGQFNRCYEVIKRKNIKTWDYLEGIGLEHWTRAHFTGERYNLMSSNIAESLNKALLPARDCPIIALLEFIRKMLCRWLESRREVIGKMDGQIPSEVAKELQIRLEDSTCLSTVNCSAWEFEVSAGSGSFTVDLLKKTCCCREFQLLKIPCRHAMAAARFHGVEYKGLVDNVYKKMVWASTVAGVILPVPDPDDIFVPEEIRQREVFPPKTRRPSGRPPKKRILSTGELKVGRKKGKPNKCGRCGKGGHNRVTCTEPLD